MSFKNLLLSAILGLSASIGLSAGVSAQINLTLQNYEFGLGDTSLLKGYDLPESAKAPIATGTGVTWDFSAATRKANDVDFVFTLQEKPRQDIFQTSQFARAFSATFIVLPTSGFDYYVYDENGWGRVGRDFKKAAIKLSATDSITMDAQQLVFSEPEYLIKFPAKMNESHTSQSRTVTRAKMTLASQGLNNANLDVVQNQQLVQTYIGEGLLKLPDGRQMQAILREAVSTGTDSFYVDGQPAPQSLLDLFGTINGAASYSKFYHFYAPNEFYYLGRCFAIGQGRDSLQTNFFIGDYQPKTSARSFDDSFERSAVTLYPNALTSNVGALRFNKTTAAAYQVKLYDMNGRLAQTFTVDAPVGQTEAQLEFSTELPNGLYRLSLINETGKTIGGGKALIAR